jgi:tyrosyl-tRNA synthetase
MGWFYGNDAGRKNFCYNLFMGVITDDKKIEELLTRGVAEVIDRDDLEKKLKSGKQLRVKLGIDPTSPNLHIGRSIPLLKLRDFQELGHKIAFIIGDFTGIIGDTSDKNSERPMLEDSVVEENMRTYVEQASKIIDIKKCDIFYNSQWLDILKYRQICQQANVFSLNDFISRENIKERLDAGKRVSLREVFYPMMQGYDSVAIFADIELGGTDQRFNLLSGRDLQRFYGQEPQNIIMNPLIEGLDGRKMSSSWGNTINLNDSSRDMFGKTMSLKDDLIITYFTCVTRAPLAEVAEHEKQLKEGVNPRDIKIKLARALVEFYYSSEEAEKEEKYFRETFSDKKIPTDIPEVKPSAYDMVTVLIDSGFASSRGDAKRVLSQKGVHVNGETVEDIAYEVKPGSVLQKGKISFIKII